MAGGTSCGWPAARGHVGVRMSGIGRAGGGSSMQGVRLEAAREKGEPVRGARLADTGASAGRLGQRAGVWPAGLGWLAGSVVYERKRVKGRV